MSRHYWLNLSCCSCRLVRNCVIVFSLIVILSTLHTGCATGCGTLGDDCTGTGQNSTCSVGFSCNQTGLCDFCVTHKHCDYKLQNCCNGYICDKEHNKCVSCYVGRSCNQDADCQLSGCAPGMVCDTEHSQCHCAPPTQTGVDCISDSGCSKGLICNDKTYKCDSRGESETCVSCKGWDDGCSNDKPCCKGLGCDAGKCVHCYGNMVMDCSSEYQSCCDGFRCREYHHPYSRNWCFPCGCGAEWRDSSECEGPGCNNLSCQDNLCLPCTNGENSTCGDNLPPCCIGLSDSNLVCFNDKCVNCSVEHDNCGEEYPDCCISLKCVSTKCQVCTMNNHACGEDKPDCCDDLTCFDGKCQNCTVENDNCTDAEDAVPCCGNLTCFNKTCQNCTVENDNCTDAEDAGQNKCG